MIGFQSTIHYVEPQYVEPLEEAVARALVRAKRHWHVEIVGEDCGIQVHAMCRDGRGWSSKLPLRADTPEVLEGLLGDAIAAV
jgi:hypothetical protein